MILKSKVNNSPTLRADTLPASGEPDMVKLAGLVGAYSPHDGCFELCIPGVCAIRRSRMATELVHATQGPVLCIVAQGAKRIMLGQEVYYYDPSRMLIFSVDMPVTAEVTRARNAASHQPMTLQ